MTVTIEMSLPDAKGLRDLLRSSPDSWPDVLEALNDALAEGGWTCCALKTCGHTCFNEDPCSRCCGRGDCGEGEVR